AAATNTMIPSSAAEKYSALPCPKWWFSSAGLAAMVNEIKATMEATRLTRDSAASDNKPTEPVIAHALAFSKAINSAVPIASHAYFLKSGAAPGVRVLFIYSFRPAATSEPPRRAHVEVVITARAGTTSWQINLLAAPEAGVQLPGGAGLPDPSGFKQ